MKRWMGLAIAALLLVAWSRSSADFMVIKIDVNKDYFAAAAPNPGGVRPMTYQPGPSPGAGDIRLTAYQPGPGSYGPGSGSGAYGPGKGGFPGMPGGGGSGQFPGLGPGNMKEMYGGGQYMGGKGKGPDLGPIGPSLGKGGKVKGLSPEDMMKGPGKGPFNPFGKPGMREEVKPRWVFAYLELTTKPTDVFRNKKGEPTYVVINHPWGKKCVVPVELVKLPYSDEIPGYIYKESMPLEFDRRMKKLAKDGNDPVRLLNLAEWALEHGLLKEFHATMGQLERSKTKPARVKSALAVYAKVRAVLSKATAGDDPAQAGLMADLREAGYRKLTSRQGHYTLWSNVPSVRNDEGLHRRLALMEESYEKFYYWLALHHQETMPPVSDRRLLAVVVADPKEFAEKHKAWGSLPLVGDGFLPRRDNVMVLSAEHLDESFTLLKKNNQRFEFSRDSLLSGSVWPQRKFNFIKGKLTPADQAIFRKDYQEVWQHAATIAYMQTFLLAEKALALEAERATISHEATRQLLFATGLLPRNVEVPEWIQYGLASFFETPEGSFYPGVALPSWTNLIDFKYHRKKSKLGSAKNVLLDLVSDRYFLQARGSAKRLDASRFRPEHLVNKAKDDQEIARSTAWALVYFLAKEGKLNSLLKYSAELDRLPRDLELSPRVLRACFSRAFRLQGNRLQEIADEWFSVMENTVLEIPEWERDYLNFRLEGNMAGKSLPTGF